MGQVLSNLIELNPDAEVVAGIDRSGDALPFPVFSSLAECSVEADVMIDFSSPQALPLYLPVALERRLPVVIATTGLSDAEIQLINEAAGKIPVFRSFNMSLGINLVQQLIQNAVKVLGDKYDVEIFEKHHRLKKDSPSGTALMLAESINAVKAEKLRYVYGREGSDALRKNDELGIHSLRGGTIVGEHEVIFAGQDEVIKIEHQAFSRQVFATGSIAAAFYLARQKPGLYQMQDMINESSAVTTLCTYSDEALVSLEGLPNQMQLISRLYEVLAVNDVFIDMISQTGGVEGPLSISFTIHIGDREKTEKILAELFSSHQEVKIGVSAEISKLTVEGPGMEFQSGIAYRVFSCMSKADISVLAVTTSENKISYVTPVRDVHKAVAIIKDEFNI
jgi:4-hydroxy-tetrahydrodipicolinate reductase